MPLLMQLLIGMSRSRYIPARGTAGLLRSFVSGYSLVPRPPPKIRPSTCCMVHLRLLSRSDGVPSAHPTQPVSRCKRRFDKRRESTKRGADIATSLSRDRKGAVGTCASLRSRLTLGALEVTLHVGSDDFCLLSAIIERHAVI